MSHAPTTATSAREAGALARYRIALVPEDDLPAATRVHIGALLAEAHPSVAAPYRRRGWRAVRPRFRVLAYRGEAVAGHCAGLSLDAAGDRSVWAMGDLLVVPEERGNGLVRPLLRRTAAQCWEEGADMIVASTRTPSGVLRDLGFRHVPPFTLYHERDAACISRPTWMLACRGPAPQAPVRLAEGHF